MFEMGNHLPDEKEKILSTLNIQFTFSQLKDIFHQSYQRKRLGYMRMMGYTNLDQCRRKYLLEFFGEHPQSPKQCCDQDSRLESIQILNRKKVKRKLSFNEKLYNLFET